jgi:N-methylhydantoinase A
MRIGVDAGGTFTDFIVLHDDGRIDTFKLRSNPRTPARVILDGLARAAGKRKADVVHGSTVATNALLERKGAAGVRHHRRRGICGNRAPRIGAELYDPTPAPKRVRLSAPCWCTGAPIATFDRAAPIGGRIKSSGRSSTARVRWSPIFFCTYRNPRTSGRPAALRREGVYLCSHEVGPEFREYERSSTTFVNAYVGPLMEVSQASWPGLRGAASPSCVERRVSLGRRCRAAPVRTVLWARPEAWWAR